MTIRTDEHGVERGNADDAGALCITEKSPNGVPGSSYRRMVSQQGAPAPLKLRNPETGEKEYDLEAVRAYNANRPGPGTYHKDIEHRTPLRHRVLGEVADGRFSVVIEDMRVAVRRDGEPFVGRVNTRQFSDLRQGGMVEVPQLGGAVWVTEAGRELLARWDAECPRLAEVVG